MALAKTTRPRLDGVLPRLRLFRLLDRHDTRPLTWVTGPPGAGKTTLVASYLSRRRLRTLWYQIDPGDADIASFFYYLRGAAPRRRQPLPLLTPEYRQGLPAFTRTVFRDLFARLGSRFALVLDNYQDVPAGALLHQVLRDALRELPPGGRIIVLSRGQPPPTLGRFHAERGIGVLDWPELRLTRTEARALARRLGGRRLDPAGLRSLHAATDGWAAGLVLWLSRDGPFGAPKSPSTRLPQVVFDYFAGELFEKMAASARDILLQAAWLPTFTAAAAEALTGQPRAGRLLAELARAHYFTSRHGDGEPVYQLHPLLREFLLARARATLAPIRLQEVQRRAAELLAREGRVEDAASLLGEARAWDALADLIRAHAAPVVMQGRAATVEAWLARLPDTHVTRDPWLLYWQGMCLMAVDPARSRAAFEAALTLFRTRQAAAGVFLAWSAAVDTYLHEAHDFTPLDRWIALLDDLVRELPAYPSPEVAARVAISMAAALAHRQPHHPEIERWMDRLRELAETGADPNLLLQVRQVQWMYRLVIGDYARMALEAEAMRPLAERRGASPFMRLLALYSIARTQSVTAAFAPCRATIATALALGRASGIRRWIPQFLGDRVACALSEGDLESASRALRALGREIEGATRLHRGFFHYLASWEALARGNLGQAEAHVGQMDVVGLPVVEVATLIMAAYVAYERGDGRTAGARLARALDVARKSHIRYAEFWAGLLAAHMELESGDEEAGRGLLARTMAFGRASGAVTCWPWRPRLMAALCVKALEAGIEVDHVRHLVRVRRLVPETPAVHVQAWPWPVRIHTLGQFQVDREDTPIRFAGKAQRRPLEVLKVLVALGGRAVPETRVTDLVWPNADGDRAQQTLAMALYRLRRLLGTETAITRGEGRIGLDPRACWVDVWALDYALAAAEAAAGQEAELRRWAAQVEALYRGPFLPDDAAQPWAAGAAERLRRRWLRHLEVLARAWVKAGDREAAAAVYQRALDVEPATEPLYRRLIEIYQQAGRADEASRVADRRLILASSPPGDPSNPRDS
jgi:ATP/maltotriose-dependent transcriptional regulator MalT/DNA-binding SARP family transcriptional activator